MKYQRKKQGFTIVELLIVIVVIAVLAAISVVAYTGIQERARKAHLAQDITSIKKAMELFKSEHGNYPQCPSGAECMYVAAIRPQLEPEYASGLSSYNFNYVLQYPGLPTERWAMRYGANSAPYNIPQSCKFGVNMAAAWYSSAPEC